MAGSRAMTHPIYSRDATVHLLVGEDKRRLLDDAIAASGFLEHVERARAGSGRPAGEFLVAIKPNLMTASVAEADSPVYTDPQLVEHLVARLRERGFLRIALCESRNVFDYSYEGRDVASVARMVGYRGDGYTIEDLTGQAEPFDYGSRLGPDFVGRTWRDADYRISFAKNKTHWQCFYTACIKNVYGCLPQWDKMKHYHGKGIEFYESAVLIADRFPVHFGFLDAWTSGDGFSGHVRDAAPNATRTILASNNIFALDWVAGEKMGVDPSHCFVMQEAMERWGAISIRREGDLAPWHPWTNVRPLVVILLNWFEEWYRVSRFFSRALASQMDPRFPPARRGRWLFRPLYAASRAIQRLFERRGQGPAPNQAASTPTTPTTYPMRRDARTVFEAFQVFLLRWSAPALILPGSAAALFVGADVAFVTLAAAVAAGVAGFGVGTGIRGHRFRLDLLLGLLAAGGVLWILRLGWWGLLVGLPLAGLALFLAGLRGQARRVRSRTR